MTNYSCHREVFEENRGDLRFLQGNAPLTKGKLLTQGDALQSFYLRQGQECFAKMVLWMRESIAFTS